MSASFLGSVVLLAYLAVILVTTLRLWQSGYYDATQKAAQTALLWLLPLIGLVMVRSALAPPGYLARGGNIGFFGGVWLLVDPGNAIGHHYQGDGGSGSHSHCDMGGHHGGGFSDGGGGGFGGGDGGGGGGHC
jgi:hypothetical protein